MVETAEERVRAFVRANEIFDPALFRNGVELVFADLSALLARVERLEGALRAATDSLWNYGATEAARKAEAALSPNLDGRT